MSELLTVACGVGVDSVAMLIGLRRDGRVPDSITFAMTGSEKPSTYEYVATLNQWLASVGFPQLTVVFKRVQRFKYGPYQTLEGNCIQNETLPSISFFFRKGCSLKWKAEPQEAYITKHWAPGAAAVARGEKMIRCIGYDAGPKDSRRGGLGNSDQFIYEYPLRGWGWAREDCIRVIEEGGLPVPPKSACYFCAVSKYAELDSLVRDHPNLAGRAIVMERTAAPHLEKIEGLWAKRGKMGKDANGNPLPGSWETYLEYRHGADFVEDLIRQAKHDGHGMEFIGESLMPEPASKERPTPYLEVWHYDTQETT